MIADRLNNSVRLPTGVGIVEPFGDVRIKRLFHFCGFCLLKDPEVQESFSSGGHVDFEIDLECAENEIYGEDDQDQRNE